jgi:hypothetical protein
MITNEAYMKAFASGRKAVGMTRVEARRMADILPDDESHAFLTAYFAERRRRLSQCDCCAQMKTDCIEINMFGLETNACPECRYGGDSD